MDKTYKKRGVGKELQHLTKAKLGPHCNLIVIVALDAVDYYPRLDTTTEGTGVIICHWKKTFDNCIQDK